MSKEPMICGRGGQRLKIDVTATPASIEVDFTPDMLQWVLYGVSLQAVWNDLFDADARIEWDPTDDDAMSRCAERIMADRVLALMDRGKISIPAPTPVFEVNALPPDALPSHLSRLKPGGVIEVIEPYPDAHPTLSVGKR